MGRGQKTARTGEIWGLHIQGPRTPMGKKESKNKRLGGGNGGHVNRGFRKVDSTVNMSTVLHTFNCFYTNADQLHNKLDELKVRIRDTLPKVIGVIEVKPKNCRYPVD